MSEPSIPVTIVNHVAIDIACPPDRVWNLILEEYLRAGKFREAGYAIERLDDPAYFRGGYRMQLEVDGTVVDERNCCVTEFDEAARRLSLYADYLTAPNGMKVHATYQAHAIRPGTRYSLDSYSSFSLDLPTDEGESDIRAAVTKLEAHFDAALLSYLEAVQAKLQV